MARFDGDPALIDAIREGVREMHRKYAACGEYDGHNLIDWLNEYRNAELKKIYDRYNDCKDPEMTADQQIGEFLYRLGQKKIGIRKSGRRITRPGRSRNGSCEVSVWSITSETALGNPGDEFASPEEREEFEDERQEEVIHAIGLRNAVGRMDDIPGFIPGRFTSRILKLREPAL